MGTWTTLRLSGAGPREQLCPRGSSQRGPGSRALRAAHLPTFLEGRSPNHSLLACQDREGLEKSHCAYSRLEHRT
ncbi:hypothetical protein ACRRTK_023948 [Alexandromys fortis]